MKSKFYKINEKMKNGLSNKICKKGFTKKYWSYIVQFLKFQHFKGIC